MLVSSFLKTDLQKINDVLGEFIFVDGRECQVFNKRIVVKEGWGKVLRFEVYDAGIEQWYNLFTDQYYENEIGGGGTVEIYKWSEEYSCHLFIKNMELQQGFVNETNYDRFYREDG